MRQGNLQKIQTSSTENSRKRKEGKCAEKKSDCLQAKSRENITIQRWKAFRVKKRWWEVTVSKPKLQRIFQLMKNDEKQNSKTRHDEEWCYTFIFLPNGILHTVQCRNQVIAKSTNILNTNKAWIDLSFTCFSSVFCFKLIASVPNSEIWLELQIKTCVCFQSFSSFTLASKSDPTVLLTCGTDWICIMNMRMGEKNTF